VYRPSVSRPLRGGRARRSGPAIVLMLYTMPPRMIFY
jgi:hypothetical protein